MKESEHDTREGLQPANRKRSGAISVASMWFRYEKPEPHRKTADWSSLKTCLVQTFRLTGCRCNIFPRPQRGTTATF